MTPVPARYGPDAETWECEGCGAVTLNRSRRAGTAAASGPIRWPRASCGARRSDRSAFGGSVNSMRDRPAMPSFPCREIDAGSDGRCFCGERLRMTDEGSVCTGCGLSATDCLNAGRCGEKVDSPDREGWRLTGFDESCAPLHGS